MGNIADRLARRIEADGPISVAAYMAEANAHYYATRDPFGSAGDFVTAPEISQMFGELIGAWIGDLWSRAGRPQDVHYVELGPGRGTLAADALRAMAAAGLKPPVHFVETSPVLRETQARRLPDALWHDDSDTLPEDGPLLIVANEFFDALPVRQLVRTEDGWRELVVALEDGAFRRAPGPIRPAPPGDAPPGTIVETCPAASAIIAGLARRIAAQGGTALIVDYGPVRSGTGDTLQAVSAHGFADPWVEPGERDLTAHVDFEALAEAAGREGVRVAGPRTQGEWLVAMGLDLRARALARSAPERADEIGAARERLAGPDEMGDLFKVMALVSPSWPEAAGFA
ncbi:MAG TPA: SAM-dependent methyltransferase [Allosphingosinicella sp.]|nr:SAM-dependent methyltransferase [Allosphingosinicella sp.]